jgi:hypothetical protein
MNPIPAVPTTSGPAFRVTMIGQQNAEAYEGVYAIIDEKSRFVHVLSADGQTHYLSIPVTSALIEWKDPQPLEPGLRVPTFQTDAFQKLGEQVQRMTEGMGRVFGDR